MPTLREQLSTYGASSLSVLELWTIALLSSQTALPSPRLQVVFSRFIKEEGWLRMTQASLVELQTAGFSQVQAERVAAICELSRRLAVLETEPLPQIQTTGDAVRLLWPFMTHLTQEVFRVLVLNAQNQVVENIELYRGTVLSTEIRIAEVLRPAIVRNCPALIVAHFHPSGDPEPSPDDLKVTEYLRQAAQMLDIDLLDHLILGHTHAKSLKSLLKW